MAHLRSSKFEAPFFHSNGDGSLDSPFCSFTDKKVIRSISDEHGEVIQEIEDVVPVCRTIPVSEDLHPLSETADLYRPDKLMESGIKLTPVSNYLRPSLEEVSAMNDSLQDVDKVDGVDIANNSISNPVPTDDGTINFDN